MFLIITAYELQIVQIYFMQYLFKRNEPDTISSSLLYFSQNF